MFSQRKTLTTHLKHWKKEWSQLWDSASSRWTWTSPTTWDSRI